MTIKHECEANVFGDYQSVYFNERFGHWLHGNPTPEGGDLIVLCCPYCGKKLELPDMMVEVSKKVLSDWSNRLRLTDFCTPNEIIHIAMQIADCIQDVLDD